MSKSIDICERLDNLAQQGHRIGYPTCDDIAEAAAEIRRLREQVDAERDYKAGLARLKEIRAESYRAGIAAAAKVAGSAYSSCAHSKNPTDCAEYNAACFIERTIRALADQPAPDKRLPGLEHIKRAMEAGECVGLDWINREIAARKGG